MAGMTYKSYSFVDKDPIIDYIRTIVQDSGQTYKYIEENSGVTTVTLRAWFYGETRKPQAATINAVLRCLNYKLAPVPMDYQIVVVPRQAEPQETREPGSYTHIIKMKKYQNVRKKKAASTRR